MSFIKEKEKTKSNVPQYMYDIDKIRTSRDRFNFTSASRNEFESIVSHVK